MRLAHTLRFFAPCALVLFVVGFATESAAAERIAILEFTSSPPGLLSATLVDALSDEARRAAVDTLSQDDWVILTREAQEAFLRDNDVDVNQLCSAECEVDIARTIGARLLVVGNVVKIGARYRLTLKLFDAKSAAVLKIVVVTAEKSEDLLDDVYAQSIELLRAGLGLGAPSSGSAPTTSPVATPVFGPATGAAEVSFSSSPPGAKVSADGYVLCAATPCTADVPMRKTTVVFELDDHSSTKQTFVAVGGLEVSANLEPLFGLLVVDRLPGNLAITIDGQKVNPPELGVRVPPGRHIVATDDPCFERREISVSVEKGERKYVEMKPPATRAQLLVAVATSDGRVYDAGADVFDDGVRLGAAGETLELAGCAAKARVVGGDGLEVSFELPQRDGGVVRMSTRSAQGEPEAQVEARRESGVVKAIVRFDADAIARIRQARAEAASAAFEERRQAYVQAAIDGHRARVASYEMQKEASSAACGWVSFPLGALSTVCGGLTAAGGLLAFYGTGGSVSDPMTMVVPVGLMTVGVVVGFAGLTEFLLAMTGSGGPCGFGISSLNWAINGPSEPEEPDYEAIAAEAEKAAAQATSDDDILEY